MLRQWVEACNNRHRGGGKVKNKISKAAAAKPTPSTAKQVKRQLEALVNKHGQHQPSVARPVSPPPPPPARGDQPTKQQKMARSHSRFKFYWDRSTRSVCRERRKSAQQDAKQNRVNQRRDLTADDLSDRDEPSSAKKVNVSVQNEHFQGHDQTPIPAIVDKVKRTDRRTVDRQERERERERKREEKSRSRSPARSLVIVP